MSLIEEKGIRHVQVIMTINRFAYQYNLTKNIDWILSSAGTRDKLQY
ncbi:MAG: hypothetical protein FKGGLIKP_00298 [Sodalis sp. Fse]|nr:MAG: hypothetical protein FKGGLIKP_00298 [Sodalis sp. Fse]UVK78771.1 MAG: hypothetical protein IGNPGNKH_00232 [Sodalis sp. Ffu]